MGKMVNLKCRKLNEENLLKRKIICLKKICKNFLYFIVICKTNVCYNNRGDDNV